MPNFENNKQGDFGVPGKTIEQTLFSPYDPYSGIDLREEESLSNICVGLEGMIPPRNLTNLDFETSANNSGGWPNHDGIFYPLDEFLYYSNFVDLKNDDPLNWFDENNLPSDPTKTYFTCDLNFVE